MNYNMESPFRNLSEEAINIGNSIIDSAQKTQQGWYWNIKDSNGQIESNNSIYNGSSGIMLFLIDLYKHTREPIYLDAAINASNWIINNWESNTDYNISFYCGIGGAIVALIELKKITSDDKYLQFAITIARRCTQSMSNNGSDLLYGHAGKILTLLHLHNEANEDWILDDIRFHVKNLLNDLIVLNDCICWERSGTSVHPLCGFAHGAGGIAFVFLELYRYFQTKLFLEIAEKAFEYEDRFFSSEGILTNEKNNWADLRKDTYTEENIQSLKRLYTTKDLKIFEDMVYMSAWCHGAPGIGLARLHAYSITHKQIHLNYLLNALDNTFHSLQQPGRNFTLCHGKLGNATLFIEAYSYFNEQSYQNTALITAVDCIEDRRGYGSYLSGSSKYPVISVADSDLMNGIAGIGHSFLQIIDPQTCFSLLLPKIKNIKNFSTFNDDFPNISFSELIYRKKYSNTSLFLDHNELDIDFGNLNSEEENISFNSIIKNKKMNVSHAYALDKKINKIINDIKSDCYLYIQELVELDITMKLQQLSLDNLIDLRFVLNSSVNLLCQEFTGFKTFIILFVSPSGLPVQQFTIGEFLYAILVTFKNGNSIKESFEIIKRDFYNESDSFSNFQTQYEHQIKASMRKGFLFSI